MLAVSKKTQVCFSEIQIDEEGAKTALRINKLYEPSWCPKHNSMTSSFRPALADLKLGLKAFSIAIAFT